MRRTKYSNRYSIAKNKKKTVIIQLCVILTKSKFKPSISPAVFMIQDAQELFKELKMHKKNEKGKKVHYLKIPLKSRF